MPNPPVSPSVVTSPLRFWHRGALVELANVPPDRTLLELLREDLRLTATKEACCAGDCGACTVVVAEPDGQELRWRSINSCIKPAHAVDGMLCGPPAIWRPPTAGCTPSSRPWWNTTARNAGFAHPVL